MQPVAVIVLHEGRGVEHTALKRPFLYDLTVVQPVHIPSGILPPDVRRFFGEVPSPDMNLSKSGTDRESSKVGKTENRSGVLDIDGVISLDELKMLCNRDLGDGDAVNIVNATNTVVWT